MEKVLDIQSKTHAVCERFMDLGIGDIVHDTLESEVDVLQYCLTLLPPMFHTLQVYADIRASLVELFLGSVVSAHLLSSDLATYLWSLLKLSNAIPVYRSEQGSALPFCYVLQALKNPVIRTEIIEAIKEETQKLRIPVNGRKRKEKMAGGGADEDAGSQGEDDPIEIPLRSRNSSRKSILMVAEEMQQYEPQQSL